MRRTKSLHSHLRRTNLKGLIGITGFSICILGFFLVTISLYSTLDFYFDKSLDNGDLGVLKITIFSAPNPKNSNLTWARQNLAVRSWLAISPYINVVLFGRDKSIFELKEGFESRVLIDSSIDFTFLGTPFFHSMIKKAQAYNSDISILIDPETIIFPPIINTIYDAQKKNQDWFIFSVSNNIFNFPYQLTGTGEHWLHEDGTIVKTNKLQELISKKSKGIKYEEKFLIAFNNPKFPLFEGTIPPFLYNKGFHNIWLINEIILSELRTVYNLSDNFLTLYPQTLGFLKYPKENNTMIKIKQRFELDNNLHLATLYGSFYYTKRFTDKITINKSKQNNYRYDLGLILEKISDKNSTVILGIVSESYRDMLMNWVCVFRKFNITNFLVCALDQDTYEFSILQGLPVFIDANSPKNTSFNNCHFGTECFQRVTKMKSRMVLKILKLGYNVLMSDVDIYWFQNPLHYLSSFGPGVLLAQSDEFNETGPINLPRKLNSGFYFARSDPITINAIQLVVQHASTSNLSEQPSFYDILCGENGINRLNNNQCIEPNTNLKVIFLDRDLFPNGAYKGIWERENVRDYCLSLGCFVLHNNWINGRKRKLERLFLSGLWNYDPGFRMCVWSYNDAQLADYL